MNLFCILFLILITASCTAPIRNYISPPDEQDSTGALPADTLSELPDALPLDSGRSEMVPVEEWPGSLFHVLPKQPMLCKDGYQLFSCQSEWCKKMTDPAWEHASHRITCESISGDTLVADSVTPQENGEWLVTFTHTKSGRKVYATTHKGAVAELAYADDLKKARKKWVGTMVFSKRGIISVVNDSVKLSIGSVRVDVLDSLLVTDVVWGVTPLPVKPLWLMVTSQATNISGFIPVRASWTNTLSSEIRSAAPWDDDIYTENPRVLYSWDDYIWEVINKRRVILEMTREQVELSWGAPEKILSTLLGGEKWVYPSHECSFVNGLLVAIDERTER